MIEYQKPLNVGDVREKIEKRIKDAQLNWELYQIILDVVKEYEGRKITKRIANKVQSILPEYTVYYSKDVFYSIRIWGNGVDYNHKKDFLLLSTWGTDGICRESEYVGRNKLAALEPGRIKQMRRGLERVEELTEQWNEGLARLQVVHDVTMEYGSTVGYTFDIQSR